MKTYILHILFLFIIQISVFAQDMRIVSGNIKDADGEPIPGVNVVEKGTTNGLYTNIDGYYEIIVPLGSTLRFSYIGMKTSEMVVTEANSKPAGDLKSRRAANPTTKNPPATVNPETANSSPENNPENTQKSVLENAQENAQENTRNKQRETYEEVLKSLTLSNNGDKSLSPYFFVLSDAMKNAHMPLKNTDVTVNIAGVIADVCVKQIYINQSENTLEAIYVFPGSTRAAVYGMTMTIGERRIEAKIKKKEQARQEYDQAKSEGKSATLLEQHRPNVFQMNVANILPGDTIIVEMRYTELLEHQSGLYEFVYPTVVGPRYSEGGEQWVDQSIAHLESGYTPQFSINTIIQAGVPIRKISSSSHSLSIESLSPDKAAISLSNPKDYEGDRDYILHYDLQGGQVESGLLLYEHDDESFFLLMMQPPKKPTSEQIPPREYVFIVDVSGSMNGFPINVSKQLIHHLASSLRPIDRFNVMLFESSNAMLYKESLPASKKNIQQALNVIDRQKGSGGTRLYPAIQNAMDFKETEGYSRTFIIVTDGFVTVEKEAFNYIRANLNEANLFPFGIGSNVNRYMIEGLAHAGMGTPYIVTNMTDAEAVGKKAIEEISQPVLTNISVDWGDFDVYDVEPVAIPDVFSERPILIYGKYKNKAQGTIIVEGIAGNAGYKQKFNVSDAHKENNQALRYLWARNQIRYFDDYAQYYETTNNSWTDFYGNHKRSTQQIEQVTNLGLKYNLLTQYTSFLAVDDVVRNPGAVNETLTKPVSTPGSPSPQVLRSSSPQNVSAPDFQLTEDEALLEEIVVVGYGTQRRGDVTSGSYYSISSSNVSSTFAGALHGRVAGLNIAGTSGEPDNNSRIRIRGTNSVMDAGNPLIILDGVPVEESVFRSMDMSNIESISVSKDASAAAIYGSRAASGAIFISSKSPKQQRLSVSLTSSFSMETPNRLPEMQNQYAQGRPENGTPVWNQTNEPFAWGPSISAANAPTYDAYDFIGTGHTFRNHVTVSGSKQRSQYSLKLGNVTQEGFFPGSKFTDNSISLKLGHEIRPRFDFDISLGYKNTKGNRLQRGYNMSGIMQGILLTPPTFDNTNSNRQPAGNAADNPYWTVDNNPFSDEANRLNGSLNINYRPIDFLSLRYRLNGEYLNGKVETALNRGSVYLGSGHIMNRDESFKSVQSLFIADFNKSWNDFSINAVIGHEYTNSGRDIDRTDGYNLRQAANYAIANADSTVLYERSFNRHSNAVFGKVTADYRQLLILEAALRSEWSSVSSKTLVSPLAGLAVNFHQLLDDDKLFSQIKPFVNISKTDKETPLYIDPVFFNSAIYNLNDASSHFENREVIIGSLKPEAIRHFEVGANIGLLRNRINLSASWYRKKTKDLLLPAQISTSSVRLENGGTLRNRGFEATLDILAIRQRDFSWLTRFAFSRERSRVIELGGRKLMLAGIENEAGSYAIEGQPLGVLYGTAYQRDGQGRMLIGADGFPLKSDELQVLGNPNPDWQLGWTNTLEYRNFSLSVLLDYRKGGDMWNGTRNVMNYYGTSQYSADHRNTTGYIFDGVLSDGSKNNIAVDFSGNNLNDNRWVRYGQYGVAEDAIEDASYLKLREISFGYRLPIRMLNKRTYLKLSVYTTNILLYSKYKGIDPDTNLTGSSNGFGLDYFNIPGAKSFGLSANWEF